MGYKYDSTREITRDLAGKYRVIVSLKGDSDNTDLMLKFQYSPTKQEIIDAVSKYLSDMSSVQTEPTVTDPLIQKLKDKESEISYINDIITNDKLTDKEKVTELKKILGKAR